MLGEHVRKREKNHMACINENSRARNFGLPEIGMDTLIVKHIGQNNANILSRIRAVGKNQLKSLPESLLEGTRVERIVAAGNPLTMKVWIAHLFVLSAGRNDF